MDRVVLSLVVLVIAVLVILGFVDRKSSSFSSREDASETILKGWLPEVMPPGSSEIWEVHWIDSNVGYGGFSFLRTEAEFLKTSIQALPDKSASCDIPREEMSEEGREWYYSGYFRIAVDWKNSNAKFWLCYSRGV